SEEKFFEPLREAIQIMKFRFSHGIVGNSQIDANRRFAYMSTIDSKTGYSFGEDMSNNYGGYDVGEYGVTVQWETSRKTNLGLDRSEEHTSELQSRENLVCRLLLEKKKKN